MDNKFCVFLRNKRGDLSLRDFGKLCGDISYTVIDTLERGYSRSSKRPACPTIETFEKLSIGTGCPVYYLAGLAAGEDPPLQEILTSAQKELLAAFESLDAVGRENVMRAIRFELFRISEENEYAEKKTGTDPDGLA